MYPKRLFSALLLTTIAMVGLTGCPHRRGYYDHHPPPPPYNGHDDHHNDHHDNDHDHDRH